MRTSELKPGTEVGSVRLVKPLDEGGMGVIWAAEHLASGTEMAVKFMLDDIHREGMAAPERFQREMQVLENAKHEHVVHQFQSGALDDGTPFIVMEMLHGETFLQRLERTEEPLSLKQLTLLLKQLCSALEHIHGLGVVHRDLKAENVFLLGQSDAIHVKVIDFGLAKREVAPGQKNLTATGSIVGSPEYMSPEQLFNSGDVDAHADLWAVAVLAYVALTLEFPFQSETLGELIMVIGAGDYTAVTEHEPDLPKSIDPWFAKAFAMDLGDRFASAPEMLEAWQEAVTQRPERPKPPPEETDQEAATRVYQVPENLSGPVQDEDEWSTSVIPPDDLVEMNARDLAANRAALAAAVAAEREQQQNPPAPPPARPLAPTAPIEPMPESLPTMDHNLLVDDRARSANRSVLIGVAVVCLLLIIATAVLTRG